MQIELKLHKFVWLLHEKNDKLIPTVSPQTQNRDSLVHPKQLSVVRWLSINHRTCLSGQEIELTAAASGRI